MCVLASWSYLAIFFWLLPGSLLHLLLWQCRSCVILHKCLGQWHPRPLACLWTMGLICCHVGVSHIAESNYYSPHLWNCVVDDDGVRLLQRTWLQFLRTARAEKAVGAVVACSTSSERDTVKLIGRCVWTDCSRHVKHAMMFDSDERLFLSDMKVCGLHAR